jgi:hypothetical protein
MDSPYGDAGAGLNYTSDRAEFWMSVLQLSMELRYCIVTPDKNSFFIK